MEIICSVAGISCRCSWDVSSEPRIGDGGKTCCRWMSGRCLQSSAQGTGLFPQESILSISERWFSWWQLCTPENQNTLQTLWKTRALHLLKRNIYSHVQFPTSSLGKRNYFKMLLKSKTRSLITSGMLRISMWSWIIKVRLRCSLNPSSFNV